MKPSITTAVAPALAAVRPRAFPDTWIDQRESLEVRYATLEEELTALRARIDSVEQERLRIRIALKAIDELKVAR